MTLEQYEKWSDKFAKDVYHSDQATLVATLGLAGEVGEVANDVKKFVYGKFDKDELRKRLADELGDCMWYLVRVARTNGIGLEEILTKNVSKLEKRNAK